MTFKPKPSSSFSDSISTLVHRLTIFWSSLPRQDWSGLGIPSFGCCSWMDSWMFPSWVIRISAIHIDKYFEFYQTKITELFAADFEIFFETIWNVLGKNLSIFSAAISAVFRLKLCDRGELFGFLLSLIARQKSEDMIYGMVVMRDLLRELRASSRMDEFHLCVHSITHEQAKNIKFHENSFQKRIVECAMDC